MFYMSELDVQRVRFDEVRREASHFARVRRMLSDRDELATQRTLFGLRRGRGSRQSGTTR